ncbi:MAG TPA: polysaccharide deacetylase family protein [Nocardioides sp.]|uniref:polysaccharide deacetylase family protein n=1 Tax=Nocardioides sp. TaxID=35761 RepID=UPI002CEBC069|nr:polysaccharide deacetylase family protein [Nocardioides sp.]HQR26475.1 polysaccharide deacetylase family protein [Nocardioides sp.]
MRSALVRLLLALLVLGSLTLVEAPHTAAAGLAVRLEPGPQTGYLFSASGEVLATQRITVRRAPAMVTSDLRHAVPGQPGFYLRITSGGLTGYEVRESPVAYLPGLAGSAVLDPPATVSLRPGRYLGYVFDADWGLASTVSGTVASASTAQASRRAVIDGRAYVLVSSGHWAGTWLPVPRPRGLTATRLTCAVPPKAAPGARVVLTRVVTDEPKLALTFDMGGRLDPALDIMERLVIDRVCATIHPTGDAAQTDTGRTVMALVAAYPELFEVGNHTMHHCNLRDGGDGASCPATPPTAARIRTELTSAEAVILDLTGQQPAPYWRPPFGAYDDRVLSAAASAGYTKTLMWDVDTIDWEPVTEGGPTAAAIAGKVVSNAQAGSIVLMHLGGYHTYDALPSMVLRLREGGLRPTSVSDLLE